MLFLKALIMYKKGWVIYFKYPGVIIKGANKAAGAGSKGVQGIWPDVVCNPHPPHPLLLHNPAQHALLQNTEVRHNQLG